MRYVFVFLLVLSTVISAPLVQTTSGNVYLNNIDVSDTSLVGNPICEYMLNDLGIQTGHEVPSFIPYSTDRLNIYSGQQAVGHVILENRVIVSISCDTIENATLDVYVTDVSDLRDIFESESQIDILNEKFSSGRINVEGLYLQQRFVNFWSQIGLFIAGVFV